MKNQELTREYILPKRIIASKSVENECIVFMRTPRQAYVHGKRELMTIKASGYIILDFGKEINGGINITIQHADNGAMLRYTFGESVGETLSNIGIKNATNDHSLRDFTLPVSMYSDTEIGDTGFRFIKLEAINGDIQIANLLAVLKYRKLEYIGSFECNDKALNDVWKMGAYTVHLNMQDYLWDGIKRDRLVWVGDMHPEVLTILSVFGDNEVINKSLDFIKNVTDKNAWMNSFASYTMNWILIQHDLFIYTGNFAYLEEQENYLVPAITNLLNCVDDKGETHFDCDFVDWSSHDTKEEKAGIHASLIIALEAGSELLKALGKNKLSRKCLEYVKILKKRKYEYKNNKQVSAKVFLAGLIDREEVKRIIKRDGVEGFSSFLGYYTLCALAEADDMSAAIEAIKNYWGKMIEYGATTFWEDFDITWLKENPTKIDEIPEEGRKDLHGDFGRYCYTGFRRSLCHGWASGPTSFMSKYILGVYPIESGMKKIRIQPDLGNLQFAKGSFPTPYGKIVIEHTKNDDGSTKTNILSKPENIEIVF